MQSAPCKLFPTARPPPTHQAQPAASTVRQQPSHLSLEASTLGWLYACSTAALGKEAGASQLRRTLRCLRLNSASAASSAAAAPHFPSSSSPDPSSPSPVSLPLALATPAAGSPCARPSCRRRPSCRGQRCRRPAAPAHHRVRPASCGSCASRRGRERRPQSRQHSLRPRLRLDRHGLGEERLETGHGLGGEGPSAQLLVCLLLSPHVEIVLHSPHPPRPRSNRRPAAAPAPSAWAGPDRSWRVAGERSYMQM